MTEVRQEGQLTTAEMASAGQRMAERPAQPPDEHADARGEEGLRSADAVEVLAGTHVELQVAADDVGDAGVADHRPGAAGIFA